MEQNGLVRYLLQQITRAEGLIKIVVRDRKRDDLHEFRIVLRRMRSLSKLYLKTAFPFPKELKSAVRATNPIRELDVLIESIQKKKYPKTAEHLARMRRIQAESLFTPTFRHKTLRSLHRYRDTLRQTDVDISSEQLVRIVEESYFSCREGYNSVDESTPQKKLHALRVEFKNTRYGLEFLNVEGLSDERDKIAECKFFQNSLGAVEDAYNQVFWLKKLYQKHPCAETRKLLEKRKKKVKKLKAASRSAQSCATKDTRSSD